MVYRLDQKSGLVYSGTSINFSPTYVSLVSRAYIIALLIF